MFDYIGPIWYSELQVHLSSFIHQHQHHSLYQLQPQTKIVAVVIENWTAIAALRINCFAVLKVDI